MVSKDRAMGKGYSKRYSLISGSALNKKSRRIATYSISQATDQQLVKFWQHSDYRLQNKLMSEATRAAYFRFTKEFYPKKNNFEIISIENIKNDHKLQDYMFLSFLIGFGKDEYFLKRDNYAGWSCRQCKHRKSNKYGNRPKGNVNFQKFAQMDSCLNRWCKGYSLSQTANCPRKSRWPIIYPS